MRALSLLLGIALILSFVLHGVIPHQHNGVIGADPLSIALHGETKKYFLALWFMHCILLLFMHTAEATRRFKYTIASFERKRMPPLLLRLFRTGLLHPKLCA